MKTALPFLFSFISLCTTLAQNSVTDKIDTDLARLLNQSDATGFESAVDSLSNLYCAEETVECAYVEYYKNLDLVNQKKFTEAKENTLKLIAEIEGEDKYKLLLVRYHELTANVYLELGDLPTALNYIQRGFELVDGEKNKESSIEKAGLYSALSVYYYYNKEQEKAIKEIQKGIEILKRYTPDDIQLGLLYNDLAVFHYSLKRKGLFVQYLELAGPFYERFYSSEHPQMLTFLQNLATGNNESGDTETAIVYYQRILDTYEKKQLSPDRLYVNTGLYLGIAQFENYEFSDANKTFESLYNQIKNIPTVPLPVRIKVLQFHLLSLNRDKTKNERKAKAVMNEIETFLDKLPPHYLMSYYISAVAHFIKYENYEQAEIMLSKAREIGIGKVNKDGEIERVAAKLALVKGEYEKALELSHIKLLKTTGTSDSIDTFENPDFDAEFTPAVHYYRLLEKGEYALVAYRDSQDPQLLQLCLEILKKVDEKLHYLVGKQSYTMGRSRLHLFFDKLVEFLPLVIDNAEQTGNSETLNLAFRISENIKAYDLKNNLNERVLQKVGILPDSLIRQRADLRKEIATFKGKEDDQAIFALQKQLNDLHNRIQKEYPSYTKLQNSESVKLEEIAAAVPENTLLIDYQLTEEELIIFLIDRAGHQLVRRKVSEELFPAITAFKEACRDYSVTASDFSEPAHFLFTELVAPIFTQIRGEVLPSNLVIVPDDNLSRVSFELLCTEKTTGEAYFKDLPYLLKEFNISYVNTASSLLYFDQQKQASLPYLGMAPVYDKEPEATAMRLRSGLNRLPFAEQEVQTIGKIWGGESLVGASASAETFKATASDYRILHLAMHAEIVPNNPYLSRFLFSGNDNPEEQLTVGELYQADLKADLCVLSACNTGEGENQAGRGVISLANAFSYAGVPAVVYSHWAVPDRQTGQIMESFHTALKAGELKSEALRQAKLKYLDQVKSSNAAHPFYWAGFVLAGDTSPIEMNTSIAGYWYVVGALLFFLGLFLFRRVRK